MEPLTASANEVIMPALKPGYFGAFDFGEEQSVTTVSGDRTPAMYQFNSETIYSLGTCADLNLGPHNNDDDNDSMEEGGNYSNQVEIVMPEGGLIGYKHIEDGEDGDRCISPQEPNNLFGLLANAATATNNNVTNMDKEEREDNADENASKKLDEITGQAQTDPVQFML